MNEKLAVWIILFLAFAAVVIIGYIIYLLIEHRKEKKALQLLYADNCRLNEQYRSLLASGDSIDDQDEWPQWGRWASILQEGKTDESELSYIPGGLPSLSFFTFWKQQQEEGAEMPGSLSENDQPGRYPVTGSLPYGAYPTEKQSPNVHLVYDNLMMYTLISYERPGRKAGG